MMRVIPTYPNILRSQAARQASSSTWSRAPPGIAPAQLTRMSTCAQSRAKASRALRSDKSTGWFSTRTPKRATRSAAARFRSSPLRAARCRLTPSRASSSAIAKPMPLLPPVMAAVRPFNPKSMCSAPYLARGLDDQGKLGKLLVFRQQISLQGRGEAALRRQAELVEIHVFRGGIDAALEVVLALQLPALAGDEAQHDHLALRHEPQWLERPGARVVVFQEQA